MLRLLLFGYCYFFTSCLFICPAVTTSVVPVCVSKLDCYCCWHLLLSGDGPLVLSTQQVLGSTFFSCGRVSVADVPSVYWIVYLAVPVLKSITIPSQDKTK